MSPHFIACFVLLINVPFRPIYSSPRSCRPLLKVVPACLVASALRCLEIALGFLPNLFKGRGKQLKGSTRCLDGSYLAVPLIDGILNASDFVAGLRGRAEVGASAVFASGSLLSLGKFILSLE